MKKSQPIRIAFDLKARIELEECIYYLYRGA